MESYTRYTTEWTLEQVVPYLLWFYFNNRPTTNAELCRAFRALMGNDVRIGERLLWHDVPYRIDRLKQAAILKEVRVEKEPLVSVYAFVIGRNGQKQLRNVLTGNTLSARQIKDMLRLDMDARQLSRILSNKPFLVTHTVKRTRCFALKDEEPHQGTLL